MPLLHSTRSYYYFDYYSAALLLSLLLVLVAYKGDVAYKGWNPIERRGSNGKVRGGWFMTVSGNVGISGWYLLHTLNKEHCYMKVPNYHSTLIVKHRKYLFIMPKSGSKYYYSHIDSVSNIHII